MGSILLIPVLKTRGHYAALVTIAFALLFKIFLEVNDVLGGPQGLKSSGLKVLGWDFNRDISLGPFAGSFYLNYVAVILALTVLGFILARRLEESWIGLKLDAVRLDELGGACFGLHIPRWKITAFTIGNFYCGVVGAFFAMMLGYIAPSNFSFGDSLILISIITRGGLGSLWGTVAAHRHRHGPGVPSVLKTLQHNDWAVRAAAAHALAASAQPEAVGALVAAIALEKPETRS